MAYVFKFNFYQKCQLRDFELPHLCVLEHCLVEIKYSQKNLLLQIRCKSLVARNDLLFSQSRCRSNKGLTSLRNEWRPYLQIFTVLLVLLCLS